MSGFCQECGLLFTDGKCKNGHRESGAGHLSRGTALGSPRPSSLAHGIGELPKANTARRLLGSGIEYVTYVTCAWVIVFLDFLTAGVLGLLCLVLVVLVVLRDFNAGSFSIAKRVSRMRVVDRRTGQSASNVQALLRNGYYLGLLLLMVLPWVDAPVLFFFKLFIALDILMILSSPQGRRLGDLLAGTQVVEAGS